MKEPGPAQVVPEVAGEGAPHRILLVEDDEVFVAVLRRMLRSARSGTYEMQHVASLAAASESLAAGRFDLVVLDLSLPDSCGAETYDTVRQQIPDTPIVIFTGDGDQERALELIHRGAQDYLVKGELDEQDLDRCFAYAIERMGFQRELEHARREAMAAARAKSAFLSTMSHEIRTPLTAILGMADLLGKTSLEGTQREYVEVLRRCGHSLQQLLDDVLDLARLDEGKLQVSDDEVEIRNLCEEVVEIFAQPAHRKRISIACDLADDVPVRIFGDGTRIRQTLVNLVGNAVKFTEEGRVVLSARRERGENGAEKLCFEVSDTGAGIPADRLDAIFERFEQADSKIAREFGGSGLGLALCHKLVQMMGGHIEVSSELGQGSCFCFELPLRAAETGAAAYEPTLEVHGQRVLVAVHDPVERNLLERMLTRGGAEVVVAADAMETRTRLREGARPDRAFDAVLLDTRMRGGGGVDVLRWARSQPPPTAPEVCIVLLPMNHRESDIETCEELGGVPLHKPVREQALARALRGRGVHESSGDGLSAPADLTGRALLLAEDSPDSRTVVLAYLRRTGCYVDAVGDGEAVLERWRSGAFDLLLMDVRMPKLDGLEATRRLREEEAERGLPRTPVVALSAQVMPEEIQECLDAGCDAHLAKPVDPPRLLATISRMLGVTPPAFVASADLADMASDYLERRRAELEELERALAAGDLEHLRTIGHNLKGSAAPYGFPQIGRAGAALESAAKSKDYEAAERALAELRGRVSSACDAVNGAPSA